MKGTVVTLVRKFGVWALEIFAVLGCLGCFLRV